MVDTLDDAPGVVAGSKVDLWMVSQSFQLGVVIADDDAERVAHQHLFVVSRIARDQATFERNAPLQREVAQGHPLRRPDRQQVQVPSVGVDRTRQQPVAP